MLRVLRLVPQISGGDGELVSFVFSRVASVIMVNSEAEILIRIQLFVLGNSVVLVAHGVKSIVVHSFVCMKLIGRGLIYF